MNISNVVRITDNVETFNLNEGQQQAADRLTEFIMKKQKEFSITGPAGTGKTTLMRNVIYEIMPLYQKACVMTHRKMIDYDISLTATTNKAAAVLTEATKQPVSTIHSFLGLKIQNNYRTGKQDLIKKKDWRPISDTLVFCDEASTIDKQLYAFIHETLDDTCKIIYLGDDRQMTPVNEGLSPVYSEEHIPVASLTQPMRNAGQPELMALCDQLRKTVKTHVFSPIREIPEVIEYLTEDNIEDFMENTFKREDPSCRALAYSNDRVHEYLNYIRDIRGYGNTFKEGEKLIFNTAFIIGKHKFYTEAPCEVVEVNSYINTYVPDTSVQCDPSLHIDYYDMQVTNPKGDSNVHRNRVVHTVKVACDPYKVKEVSNKLMKAKDWIGFYSLKKAFADLRGADAATVYKAQGSTYDTVLIDLNDFNKAPSLDIAARLLYVSVSRARFKVYLWGRLSSRFFL